jgi:hypothetical protein
MKEGNLIDLRRNYLSILYSDACIINDSFFSILKTQTPHLYTDKIHALPPNTNYA